MASEILEKHSKYFFTASFLGVILLSIFLIRSFVVTIVSAVLITYICYPLYRWLLRRLRNKYLASIVATIFVVLIIIIPIIFAAQALIGESIVFFQRTNTLDLSTFLEGNAMQVVSEYAEVEEYVRDGLNRASLYIAKSTSDFIVSLPKKVLQIFVLLFLVYYLFMDGLYLTEKVKDHIPLKEKYKQHLTERFSSAVYASLYGVVITAIVQGVVGSLGLWIFGVSSPILWGLVMIILSMLPFLGAALVWLPAAIYNLMIGETFNGFGLLLYGVFLVSTIDNIIRPKIIGTRGKIHPAMVLLGVLGGIEMFGLLGIILGPLILAILMVFLELYLLEKEPHHKKPKRRKHKERR